METGEIDIKRTRVRHDRITPEDVDRMKAIYALSGSPSGVAKALHRDRHAVIRHLRQAGVHRPRKVSFNEDLFETWSDPMAWCLGLIFGDGYVQNDIEKHKYRMILAGTEEVCTKVAHILELERTPTKDKRSNCWRLEVAGREFVDSLSQYGLSGGEKATSLRFPVVPAEYLASFLRGLWDSDGSWRRRGKHLSASYGSASHDFILDLKDTSILKEMKPRTYSWKPILNGKTFSMSQICLNKDDSIKLSEFIYSTSTSCTMCSVKHARATIGV